MARHDRTEPITRQTGRFAYHVRADRWEWDDGVFNIHGYRPGEVTPTMELVLSHKHDADRGRVRAMFEEAIATGAAFNLAYRIVVHHEVRRVVMVGGGVLGPEGDVEQIIGYYVDLTPEFADSDAEAADKAVEAAAAGRAAIEQAKGILMLGYGLDADAAFAMLRWWSRNRNVKVRDLAETLIGVARGGHVTHPALRGMLDGLIDDLTAPAGRSRANHDGGLGVEPRRMDQPAG